MKNFKIVLLFIAVYAITLPLYFTLKPWYNESIITISTYLSCFHYNLHVKQIDTNNTTVNFILENGAEIKDFYGDSVGFTFDLALDGESIFFNTPLTLALLISIVVVFKQTLRVKLKAVAIGMGTLVSLHVGTFIIMVMSAFAGVIVQSSGMVSNYLSEYYLPALFLNNFATFLNSYAIYFEPFLIGLLTFMTLNSANDPKSDKEVTLKELL